MFSSNLLSYWLGYAIYVFFVREVVTLLGVITEKMGLKTCLWSELEHKQ